MQTLDVPLRVERRRRSTPGFVTGALLAHVLDGIDYGVMVVSGGGRLQAVNAPARALLATADPLRESEGFLHPADGVGHQLRRLLQPGASGSRRFEVFPTPGGMVPVAATVLDEADSEGEPLILLTTGKQATCEPITLIVFARAMNLTPAESRVLESLAKGGSPAGIAALFGLKEATVRTQIRSVLEKTRSAGIRDLQSKLAMLPPIRPIAQYPASVVQGTSRYAQ